MPIALCKLFARKLSHTLELIGAGLFVIGSVLLFIAELYR